MKVDNYTFEIPIQHKEWLNEAIEDTMRTLTLTKNGTLPEVLRGRFLMQSCLRLLRCVFGANINNGLMLERLTAQLKADGDYMAQYIAEHPEGDDPLPDGCAICSGSLFEEDAVNTAKGLAHLDCAESRYPNDDSRDPGIPKPGM